MGLEDFIDTDNTSSNNSESTERRTDTSQETQSKSKLGGHDAWSKEGSGELTRKGPYGYPTWDEYYDTIDGKVEKREDLFKYKLPVFPRITKRQECSQNQRYELAPGNNIVTCVSATSSALQNLGREMIMLCCGSTEKDECIDVLESRFRCEVDLTTKVWLHMFSRVRHVTKMAMTDEFVDEWSLNDKDRALKAIYGESYTQQFREKDTGKTDLKHINDMDSW
jgi:hypothetical protein